ncbi:MAG: hypothetical protein ACI9VR_000364 [Cognaticolwellia sp.]|jgi:hypothetical protein
MSPADLRSVPLDELERHLTDALGDLPHGWTARRQALEHAADSPAQLQALDPLLLAVRALESIETRLPTQFAGLRRGEIWEQDAISVSFDAWRRGQRVLIRALRPQLRADPVWLRRLQAGTRWPAPAPLPRALLLPGEWPMLEYPLHGPSLSQLLPADERPDTQLIALALEGGLAGLEALHARGQVHGHLSTRHLIRTEKGFELIWLDPVLAIAGSPAQDLRDLGRAVSDLDPSGSDPIGELARSMANEPPPSVDMARALLTRTLAEALAERRHELAMRARDQAKRAREERLLAATKRLGMAISPPVGQFCLRAGQDSVIVVVDSDGTKVKGGPVAGMPARFMPRVWDSEQGLDPVASRALLRAWASRKTGDETRRAKMQTELGVDDVGAMQMCRWMSCQARLRAVRMLLELGS